MPAQSLQAISPWLQTKSGHVSTERTAYFLGALALVANYFHGLARLCTTALMLARCHQTVPARCAQYTNQVRTQPSQPTNAARQSGRSNLKLLCLQPNWRAEVIKLAAGRLLVWLATQIAARQPERSCGWLRACARAL